MESRAVGLVRNFCISLDEQSLDAPVIEYLANLLVEVANGEEDDATLAEVMNAYFTKRVTPDDLRQLSGILKSRETVETNAVAAPVQQVPKPSTLNAQAAAFVPGSLKKMQFDEEGPVPVDMVEFLESHLQDPENDPLELLSNLFPSVDLEELEALYKTQNCSFVWTLDALMTRQGGFETVSYGKKEKRSSLEVAPSPATPFQIDWSEEAFPELPGLRSAPMGSSSDAKTSFLDIAKKKRPPAEKPPPPRAPPEFQPNRALRQRSSSGEEIPWVVTGDAVSKQYSELRAAASEYAKLRNACFCEATKAYISGNKALARELGKKGRMYCEQMKDCHHEASEAIFNSRNSQLKRMMNADSPQVLDLHGLHVAEAKRILKRELSELSTNQPRGQRGIVHLLVGTGHHTKGARTPSRLPSAVQEFLKTEGYSCRPSRPGVIVVEL